MTEENKLKQCFKINDEYIKNVATIPNKFFLVSPELPLTIGNSVHDAQRACWAWEIARNCTANLGLFSIKYKNPY